VGRVRSASSDSIAMAVAGPIDPISIPTALGAREVLDVGQKVLDLQKIDNPQTSLHACASRYGAQAIRSLFEKLELKDAVMSFEELNLSDNNIGDDGCRWLMNGLNGKTKSGEQVGQHLKVLLMPRARFGAEGMQAIGGILGASKSLENVILSSNICDAEGVEGEFSAGLAKNKSVKSLCLAGCRLGDRGVASLCDGPLKSHPKLEHVSVQYNRLEESAAKSVCAMLAVNEALRFLDLSGNSLGAAGALALVEGVKKNKGRLQRLAVQQNELQAKGVRALSMLFTSAEGKSLEYLDLRHNAVPFHDMAKIRQELGRPMDGDTAEGWMLMFGTRQLLLNR